MHLYPTFQIAISNPIIISIQSIKLAENQTTTSIKITNIELKNQNIHFSEKNKEFIKLKQIFNINGQI